MVAILPRHNSRGINRAPGDRKGRNSLRNPRRWQIKGYLKWKNLIRISQRRKRGECMPTSKKQMEKPNKVKKVKAEELSKQAAAGSQEARSKLKKLEKKLK